MESQKVSVSLKQWIHRKQQSISVFLLMIYVRKITNLINNSYLWRTDIKALYVIFTLALHSFWVWDFTILKVFKHFCMWVLNGISNHFYVVFLICLIKKEKHLSSLVKYVWVHTGRPNCCFFWVFKLWLYTINKMWKRFLALNVHMIQHHPWL